MRHKGSSGDEAEIPLFGGSSGGSFLQRSAKLRNTRWCLGLAVYTGRESKIQMNSSKPSAKSSHVERSLNKLIIAVFGFLFLLCVTGSVGSGLLLSEPALQGAWYLVPSLSSATFDISNPGSSAVLGFFSFLILLRSEYFHSKFVQVVGHHCIIILFSFV